MKHIVYLFGSRGINIIPEVVEQHIKNILEVTSGDVEFVVGDADGVDSAFHKSLAKLGASSKAVIYCMDTVRNNTFGLKVNKYTTEFNSEAQRITIKTKEKEYSIENIKEENEFKFTRDYYQFKDKRMIEDCTFAICVWDGISKGTEYSITALNARNKSVYTYRLS